MNKPVLLLLHGALGSRMQLLPLVEKLSAQFDVHALNFAGHGGSALPEAYTCDLFVKGIVEYVDTLPSGNAPVNIFGYSMGGYMGTYMALHHPQRVNKVFAIATRFGWDETSAAFEIAKLDVAKLKEKAPAFCEALKQEHAPQDWETLVHKTREMMVAFSKNPPLKDTDFPQIQHEIMIALGDRDKTADLKNSVSVYSKLSNGKLMVLPGTGHPLEKIDVDVLTSFVIKFFQ